jgi:enterochelin esterase family protein
MSARKRSPNIAFRRVRLIRAVLFMTAIVVAASAQSDSASVIRAEAVPYGQGPDVSADRRITFHVRAPNAKQVTVGGLDGGLEPIPPLELRNDGSGNWSVTTPPLTPDIYTYGFLIDGVGFADPSNPHATTNLGVGPISIVRVPGSPSTPWDPQDVPHGIIAHHMFRSRVVNDNRDYYVYTPPNYDPRRRNAYPTLYLLNGMGGEARGWFDVGAAHVILDNLIGQGKAKPMVIVAPLAYGSTEFMEKGDEVFTPEISESNSQLFSRILLEEIMPQVETNYHVSKRPEDRAIAGLSMGGAEALDIGLHHLERFQSVAGLSAAIGMSSADMLRTTSFNPLRMDPASFARAFPKLTAESNSRLRLLWIACGTDDELLLANRQFKEWLKSLSIRFTDIETPGAHRFPVWRRNLVDLAQQLFR